jgi:hypothetical protein
MSKHDFLQVQELVFQHTGADVEKLRHEFRLLGYDDHMQFANGRSAVLSIHGTVESIVERVEFDAVAYEEAIELPCMVLGEKKSFDDGN